jgi:hypothetical protein
LGKPPRKYPMKYVRHTLGPGKEMAGIVSPLSLYADYNKSWGTSYIVSVKRKSKEKINPLKTIDSN